MPASTVTSSIPLCEVWYPMALMTAILTLSAEALSPPHSSLVKFKARVLYLRSVMVVNTFHDSQNLVSYFCFLHYVVETQTCSEVSSSQRGILSGRQQLFPFHHSLKPITAGLLPLFVGPSGKKDAVLHNAPGAPLICSLPAPWEGRGRLFHGLLVTAECHLVLTGVTSESGPAGTWRETGGC